jgi:hypothetical protein
MKKASLYCTIESLKEIVKNLRTDKKSNDQEFNFYKQLLEKLVLEKFEKYIF